MEIVMLTFGPLAFCGLAIIVMAIMRIIVEMKGEK